MATPIIMPKFGQMTEESAIVEWLKKEGDKVNKGDILFTVETDKSVMEVESFEAGTLLKITVPPRVNVPVQSTVGFLGKPGEAIPNCRCSGACRTQTCMPQPHQSRRRSPSRPDCSSSFRPQAQHPSPRRHSPARSGDPVVVPHQPARCSVGETFRH
jgi:pyruvate/2-oxoglutarate dehydrogenase complex dihydrolipoamide acyltransferase (E2) component